VHLVDLDRVDASIHVAVAGLGDRGDERLFRRRTRARSTSWNRSAPESDIAAADLSDHPHDVDGERVLGDHNRGVALLVDKEEILSPGIEAVELGGLATVQGSGAGAMNSREWR
jgi:hypothetical protein